MVNLAMIDQSLVRLHEPDKKMGHYYSPDVELRQLHDALQLCVKAIDPMPHRTRAKPQCAGETKHSSALHIRVGLSL